MKVSRIRSGSVKEALLLEENKYGRSGHLGNVASEKKKKETEDYRFYRNKNCPPIPPYHPLNKVYLTKVIGPLLH